MKRVLSSCIAVLSLSAIVPARADVNSTELYKKKCAMCHGEDGKGKTKMGQKVKIPEFGSAEAKKESDEDLKFVIVNGGKPYADGSKSKMPAWKEKLSAEEIDALLKHVRKLGDGK
jgi:mono/diheme cytochrome c family protein